MKEILLANLTRMGDLIQTTPVLTGLKKKHPDARVTLLVNSSFKEICKDLPFIDNLVSCDMTAFRMMRPGEEHSLVECFRRIEEFLDEVNRTRYDLVVSFTASKEAMMLSSLLNTRELRGVTTGADGTRVIRHPWQRYFMGEITFRRCNPFHLCDMMIKSAEIPHTGDSLCLSVSDEESAKARALLSRHGVGEGDLLVGFHLGANQEVRAWPPASFARLGDRLARSLSARILITGSEVESALGKEYEAAAASRAVNLIGKTNLRETAALLKRCSLMVSNDTGPLHMATAVGTTVIELPFGHACFRETGPYGENHYVAEADIFCIPCGHHVKCVHHRCKELVTPEAVFELASRILSDGRVEKLEDGPVWKGVRVFRSFFAPDGMQDYVPLIRRPLTYETFYQYLYRETWPFILDGLFGFSAEKAVASIEAKASAWHGEEDPAELLRRLREDLSTLRKMEALAGDGLKKISLVSKEAKKSSPNVKLIQRTWKDAPAIDREIEKLGRVHPALMAPFLLFRLGKESLEGKELGLMAKTAVGLYSDLKEHFSMLEKTLGLLLEKHVNA